MRWFLRSMRIAWSVVCTIVCVLLIVLWVDSYRIHRQFELPRGMDAVSDTGYLSLLSFDRSDPDYENPFSETGLVATWSVHLPYWSLIILFGALAMIPLLLRRRFSLRTLFIATTLVAAVLGLIFWMSRAG